MQVKQITTTIEMFIEIKRICEEGPDNALTIESITVPDREGFMSVFIRVLDPAVYIDRLYPLLYDSKSIEETNYDKEIL